MRALYCDTISKKYMLLLSSPFLSSLTRQTVRGYCDRQSDLLLMYFFFSLINCMLNKCLYTTLKSAHTGHLGKLKRADSSLRIRERPSRLRMQPLQMFLFSRHYFPNSLGLVRRQRSQEMAAKMNRNGLKIKEKNTECKTMNVDLLEGESTWHLNCHLNWNSTWTLNPWAGSINTNTPTAPNSLSSAPSKHVSIIVVQLESNKNHQAIPMPELHLMCSSNWPVAFKSRHFNVFNSMFNLFFLPLGRDLLWGKHDTVNLRT